MSGRQRDGRLLVSSFPAVIALATVVADQLTKAALTAALTGVSVARAANDGAAFGLLPATAPLLASLSIAVAVAIGWQCRRMDPAVTLAGALIIGGIGGNLIDRLRYGFVIDFLYLDAPLLRNVVFNIADVAIFAGLALMVWALTRGKGRAAQGRSGGPLRVQQPIG